MGLPGHLLTGEVYLVITESGKDLVDGKALASEGNIILSDERRVVQVDAEAVDSSRVSRRGDIKKGWKGLEVWYMIIDISIHIHPPTVDDND